MNDTRGARRVIVAIQMAAVLLIVQTGCRWHSVPIKTVESRDEMLLNKTVRLTLEDGSAIEMVVREIELPLMSGLSIKERGRSHEVNLEEVLRLEVKGGDGIYFLLALPVFYTIAASTLGN